MTVTGSTAQDLPRMIELLKSSLGENLVPKSEAYFTWKHMENPFGASRILLAREGDQVIGLRAFMYWDWASGKERVKAVRAVDTATDPAHQGKGIFRKLTLQAVDECKSEGVGLVFNSPNPISMAGYLKMGWKQAGRMPIYLGPGSMIPRTFKEPSTRELLEPYAVDRAIAHLQNRKFREHASEAWHTPLSYQYLYWRYHTCPVVSYGAISEPGQFGYIFRLKKLNRFYELRICEAWTEREDKTAAEKARKALRKLVSKLRPLMVSCAPSPDFMAGREKPGFFFGPFLKGPVVTVRPLAWENLDNFEEFHHWQPSMGTMELF